jgi:putative heme-binding domain-containing protein
LEIRELIRPYEGNTDPEIGRVLLAATAKAPGFWNLTPPDLWHTVHRCPPEITDLAKPLVSQLQAQEETKQQRLAELDSLVGQGDALPGREVFSSEVAKCSVCHHVGDAGGNIGPDLSRIGRIRSGRDLLEAIVFPSSTLVREYQPYSVVTLDGVLYTGIISRDAPSFIELQTQLGQPVTIQRDDIETIAPSPVSIMPQGLDKTLTEQQLADLVVYLMSLK